MNECNILIRIIGRGLFIITYSLDIIEHVISILLAIITSIIICYYY